MISEVFTHCPGIGPKTEKKLKRNGIASWDDLLHADHIPFSGERKKRITDTVAKSLEAHKKGDIGFFISSFPVREHWRILREYFHAATFFDIETTGLSWYESHATVISAFHRGELRTFVHGKNLDDFLQLCDESRLLVSFNGNCFDMPFLEHTFNVPALGQHVDLRWIAYHAGYRGGLKIIEKSLGIERPREISCIDGFEAVNLYHRWMAGDDSSLATLIRYCSADAVAAYLVARKLIFPQEIPGAGFGHDELFAMAMDAA